MLCKKNFDAIMEYLDIAKELVTEVGGKWGILGLADGMQISGEAYNWEIGNATIGEYTSSICYSLTMPSRGDQSPTTETPFARAGAAHHWYNTFYNYAIQPIIQQISNIY